MSLGHTQAFCSRNRDGPSALNLRTTPSHQLSSSTPTISRVTRRFLYLFSLHHFEHLSKLWVFTCPNNYALKTKREKKNKIKKEREANEKKILFERFCDEYQVKGCRLQDSLFPSRTAPGFPWKQHCSAWLCLRLPAIRRQSYCKAQLLP